jgi:hypothetical protein
MAKRIRLQSRVNRVFATHNRLLAASLIVLVAMLCFEAPHIIALASAVSKAQVGIFYDGWFPEQWPLREATPLLGLYSSDNVAVVDQHLRWLNGIGVSWLEYDVVNSPYPDGPAYDPHSSNYNAFSVKVLQVVDLIVQRIAAHGYNMKITFLIGGSSIDCPTCNAGASFQGDGAGPGLFQKRADGLSYANHWLNYIYNRWGNYLLQVNGKAFVSFYVGTPHWVTASTIPSNPSSQNYLSDSRFTIRYATGYGVLNHQPGDPNHQQLYPGEYSIINCEGPVRNPNGAGEIVAVTGYCGNLCWNNGSTFQSQWNTAKSYGTPLVYLNQWNSFTAQSNPDCSNDLEPSQEWGYTRLSQVGALTTSYLGVPTPVFPSGWVSSVNLLALPVSGALQSGPDGDQSSTSATFTPSLESVSVHASGSQQYLALATSQVWNQQRSIGASIGVCEDGIRISGDMFALGADIAHRHLSAAVSIDTPSAGSHVYTLCYKTDPGGVGFVSGTYLALIPVSGALQSGPNGDQSTTSTTFTSSKETIFIPATGSQQYLVLATSQLWGSVPTVGSSMAACRDGSHISGDMFQLGSTLGDRRNALAIALDTPSLGDHTYSLCFKTDPGGVAYVSNTYLAVIPVIGTQGITAGPVGDTNTQDEWFISTGVSLTVPANGQVLLLASSQIWNDMQTVGSSVTITRDGGRITGDYFAVGANVVHRELAAVVALDSPSPGTHIYSVYFKTDMGFTG